MLIAPEDIRIAILSSDHDELIEDFDCGDEDLNAFLREDALIQQEQELSRTTLFTKKGELVGFCTLLTDKLVLSKEIRKTLEPEYIPYKDIPALKLGRFALQKKYQQQGVGTLMIKYALGKALNVSEEVGCRVMTVDAYKQRLEWYMKRGFELNEDPFETEDTVSLRYDLQPIKKKSIPTEKT